MLLTRLILVGIFLVGIFIGIVAISRGTYLLGFIPPLLGILPLLFYEGVS